jgi:hypothetical protein
VSTIGPCRVVPLISEAVRDVNFLKTACGCFTESITAKLTVLSSRKNSLVSIYDVSGDKDGLLRSHALPYSLSGRFPNGPHAGFYVAQPHPDSGNDTTASLLQLTNHGGIYQTALALRQDTDTTPLSVAVDVSWSSAVHRLATASSVQRPDVGRLGARAMEEVDFRGAYQRILSLASSSYFRVAQNPALLFRTLLPARRHRGCLSRGKRRCCLSNTGYDAIILAGS